MDILQAAQMLKEVIVMFSFGSGLDKYIADSSPTPFVKTPSATVMDEDDYFAVSTGATVMAGNDDAANLLLTGVVMTLDCAQG